MKNIKSKLASQILKKNFFGAEDWETIYGLKLTKQSHRQIPNFPWDDKILNAACPFVKDKRVKETHFAFLGLDRLNGEPLNIMMFQELHPATSQPRFYFHPNPWYETKLFANQKTCGLRWYLMSLEIVPNSTGLTYEEQTSILPPEYEVPYAIEEIAKNIFFYRKNRLYINSANWSRCRDVFDCGHVSVGFFDIKGLDIYSTGDRGHGHYSIGVTGSRKWPAEVCLEPSF